MGRAPIYTEEVAGGSSLSTQMNDNPPTVNISYATACTAIVALGIRRANTENAHLIWQIDNAACELVSVTGLQWLYDAAVNNFKKL